MSVTDLDLLGEIQLVLQEDATFSNGLWSLTEVIGYFNQRQYRFLFETKILAAGATIGWVPSVPQQPLPTDWITTIAAMWHDFWTGVAIQGGRSFDAPTTIDRMPLYVRAGSILPLGPDVEYAAEKSADPIELRVYRGANGAFTLYEDENDSYDYEKGAYATIPLSWDDSTNTLTIGDRTGSFPGMLEKRTFRVVFVGENHGIGGGLTETADKTVEYSGKKITVTR